MNAEAKASLPDILKGLVVEHGIGIVADALVELAQGDDITDILRKAERRAIRAAADAQAERVLGDDDA